jgi:phage-related baseplate assembly protein
MSVFSAVNLAEIPAPEVVETLDYETILAALTADAITRAPELADALALESEPVTKALEEAAYRETVIRARVNDAARAVMLAFASGADLRHLGALFGVAVQVIQEADPEADPPLEEILESDARLRARIQLAPEAYTVAGSRGSYTWHAMAADTHVKDVYVWAPQPVGDLVGEVRVVVLSDETDGTPSAETLAAVSAALTAETVRPLTDKVYVQAATIVDYTVVAGITTYEGPDSAVVLAAAEASVSAKVAELHAIGHDVTRSALFAALHVAGVQNVDLVSPAADVAIDDGEAGYCTGITLTHAGTDL